MPPRKVQRVSVRSGAQVDGTVVTFGEQAKPAQPTGPASRTQPDRPGWLTVGSYNTDNNDDDDVPMPDADTPSIENVEGESQKTEISKSPKILGGGDASKIKNLQFFLDWISGVDAPKEGDPTGLVKPGTDIPYVLDISSQFSPRSSFAVLKIFAYYYMEKVRLNGALMAKMRDNTSPNLDLTLNIIKNFVKRADDSLKRGAVFQKQQLGKQINIGIYMKDGNDTGDENSFTGIPANVKSYPFTRIGEEYGIVDLQSISRGYLGGLFGGGRLVKGKTVLTFEQYQDEVNFVGDRLGVTNWEEDLVESTQNMIDVKTIFDQILDAEKRIDSYQMTEKLDIQEYERLEPPFYPKMSSMEMRTITAWQSALQFLREQMLKDETYEFALTVAGMMTKGTFGVEQLLSNKTIVPNFASAFPNIPSASDKTALIDSERDQLYRLKYQIEDAFNSQRMADVRNEQLRLNEYEDPNAIRRNATSEKWISEVSTFIAQNRATRIEVPKLNAPLATRENTPLSLESRRLEQAKDVIDDMIKGVVVENSRERMVHALEWLQKVEILKRAEMTPVFKAGIETAMANVRAFCCKLRSIKSFQAFAESPDSTAKTYFAQLVALEIADFENVFPKKNYLDKRYRQVNDRKRRLLNTMNETFSLGSDGKVYSSFYEDVAEVPFNPALYAFENF